ncbi:MAG TPA: hypothetical protein VFQ61_06330 [Polyangiaceae bacterium]|nr:hypothetical protein [Polyangiaceae bacterium]
MIPIGLRELSDPSTPRVIVRPYESWERLWRAEEAHEYFEEACRRRHEFGLTVADFRALNGWIDSIYNLPAGGAYSNGVPRGRLLNPRNFFGSESSGKALRSWHRADLGYTVATGVSQLLDQSANFYTLTQATATNQPVTSATGLNGRFCLSFDASNDYLSYPSGFAATVAGGNDKPFASWSVARFSTDVLTTTKYSYLWGFGYSGGNSPYIEFYGGYTQTAWVCSKCSNTNVNVSTAGTSPGVAANTNYFIEYYHTGTTSEVIVNGVSCTMSNGGALDAAQADVNTAAIHALPRSTVVSSNAALLWGEQVFASGKPTALHRFLMTTYKTRQWGF